MMRFWSPVALPAGRMPGRHQHHAGPGNARAALAASSAEQTSPSTPMSRACAARAAASSVHAHLVAGGGKIGIVVGREHGHGQNAQLRAALAFDRRLHGLRIGVHGQERRAELRDALDALGHRVADIVQLEIEKHLLAGGDQSRGERQAAGEGELIADLVEPHRIAEPRHHRLGRRHRRHIESHDQSFARIQRQRLSSSHHHPRHFHQPLELRCETDWRCRHRRYCPCRRTRCRRAGSSPARGSPARRSQAREFAAAPSASADRRRVRARPTQSRTRGP